MHRYLPLLIVWAFSLPAAPIGAGEQAAAQPYDRLDRMDAAARAAWVESMLSRLDEANGVVLASEAVAKQRERHKTMLRAFVENRADWRTHVASFEEELVVSQRAAIEHLTRRYRLKAYQNFRTDREGFEKRRLLLERVLAAWQNSDAPRAEQHKLVDWLQRATQSPLDRDLGTALAVPQFEPRRAFAAAPSPHTGLPEIAMPLPSASHSSGEPAPNPRPAAFLADRMAASSGSFIARPAGFHAVPEVDLPLAYRGSEPRPNHVTLVPSFEQNRFAAVLGPGMVASASPQTPWRHPSSVAAVTRPSYGTQPPMTSRSSPLARGRSGDPLAFARVKVDRLAMGGETSSSNPIRPVTAALEPAASARDVSGINAASDRRRETPRSSLTETPEVSLAALDRHASTAPDKSAGLSTPNLEELTARIRGNNVALRKLAAQLYEDRSWNAKSLGVILDQLAPLVQRKDDLKLMRELIPLDQRGLVGDLESGSDLISELGTKISRARGQAQKGEFQGTRGDRKAELDRLDRLSERLSGLVFRD